MAKVGRYEGLQLLPEFPFPIYATPGLEHPANSIAPVSNPATFMMRERLLMNDRWCPWPGTC